MPEHLSYLLVTVDWLCITVRWVVFKKFHFSSYPISELNKSDLRVEPAEVAGRLCRCPTQVNNTMTPVAWQDSFLDLSIRVPTQVYRW